MAHRYPAIDLNQGDVPDIAEVAEEVHRTKWPRVIRRDTEELAVVMPAAPRHTQPRAKPFTHDDGGKQDGEVVAALAGAFAMGALVRKV